MNRMPRRADVAKAKVSWFKLLTFRQTWAFFVGKFMTDPDLVVLSFLASRLSCRRKLPQSECIAALWLRKQSGLY